MFKALILVVIIALCSARTYPMYKQCDDRWRNEQLGTSPNTICSAGCLMSSASMALKGIGVDHNPSTLNAWLTANGGYVSGDLFVWASINKFGVQFQGKTSRSQIKSNLDRNNIVILNVHNGAHWVLATGYDNDNIFINDPNYSTPFYTLDQIVEGQVGVYSVGNSMINIMIQELEAFFKIKKNKLIEADKGKIETLDQ